MTPLNPTTPYGAAKAFSAHMARIYRIAYSMPTCSAILYNHESPRRGGGFVTMKIARAAARIKQGLQQELMLGSLDGRRDWGWAPDYVQGMWLMLQQPTVDDFVLATGELHSVQDFVDAAFNCVGLKWRDHVRQDPGLLTTVEPMAPCGNPSKAQRQLGWKNTVPFNQLVARLVESEMKKNPMKKAFVTGITGQDGSYLTELLLEKGYQVHGLVRRASTMNRSRIDHLAAYEHGPNQRLFLHYGDLADSVSLVKLLYHLQPDEIYNLAAQSHVRVSFDIPEYTADITGVGAARILEAIIESGIGKKVRFYQASSSEMFGKVQEVPQRETTSLYPRSPYGCAKVFAHWLTINYRESYNLFACSGILFNHESPRRGESFVTRKISLAAARIKQGLQKELVLGNLDSKRDWGYAQEYVEGMWRMLQQDQPDDFVLATNETHTIGAFLDAAFGRVNLDWHDYVEFDERFLRPAEVDLLIGDYSKAERLLGWAPKTRMKALAELMVDADLAALGTR